MYFFLNKAVWRFVLSAGWAFQPSDWPDLITKSSFQESQHTFLALITHRLLTEDFASSLLMTPKSFVSWWTTLVTAQCLLHLPGFIFKNSLCTLLKTPTHLNILTFINVTKTSCTPQFKQFVSHGLRTTTKFYSDNRCIFTHEAAGRKFTSLFFFSILFFIKNSFQISWISVKQYNENKTKKIP